MNITVNMTEEEYKMFCQFNEYKGKKKSIYLGMINNLMGSNYNFLYYNEEDKNKLLEEIKLLLLERIDSLIKRNKELEDEIGFLRVKLSVSQTTKKSWW